MTRRQSPAIPAGQRTRNRRLAFAVGLPLAVISGVHLAYPGGTVDEITYLMATVGAALAASVALLWHQPVPRRAWLLVAIGVACSAIGDVIDWLYGIAGSGTPDVSWGDPFWLASYVFLAFGINRLIWVPGGRRRGHDVDAIIDVAAVALVASVTSWLFLIQPMLDDNTVAMSSRLVSSTYPVLDLVLLTLILRVLARRTPMPAAAWVLFAGIGLWLATDALAMVDLRGGGAGEGGFLDIGLMVGVGLLGLAPWLAPRVRPAANLDHGTNVDLTKRAAWLVGPLLVPIMLALRLDALGRPLDLVVLLGTNVALAALLLARWTRLADSRNQAIFQVEDQERFYRTIAATSSDAVLVVDASRRIIHDSPAIAGVLRTGRNAHLGEDLLDLIGPADRSGAEAAFALALANLGSIQDADVDLAVPAGGVRCVSLRIANLLDDPAVDGLVVSVHDTTDRRQAAEALTRQALHDSLTGLANRVLFRDRLEQALARRDRLGIDPAVIFLDVDGFKKVNDSLGHEAGDDLLVTLAGRISRAVRSEDTVARLGGDEFAILIDGSRNPVEDAIAAAERVIEAVAAPVPVGGRMLSLSASLGIEIGGREQDASSVLRNADIAMYRAKASGRGRWVRYDPTMRAVAVERLELETDLASALANRELRLMYQPVVDLSTGDLIGFEALLRWDHPRYGVISPDTFIPIAEETGLIGAMGEWVLGEACRSAVGWQVQHPRTPALTMAVNISGVQMARPELPAQVADALLHSGLAPESLILELTESVLVQDPTAASARLRELQKLGVRVAVDDFGTGYSSLSYLSQFSVDILKIDRSFVMGISAQAELPSLVKGLLDLGRTMDLQVVAEGIEDRAQLERLRDGNCPMGQGFLFAEPLTPIEVERVLKLGVPLGAPVPLAVVRAATERTTSGAGRQPAAG